MTIRIIGDEIHFHGELVGLLANTPPATVRAAFKDALGDCGDPVDVALLDSVEKQASEAAKGGLLRMPDLARIISQLKEG